MKSDKSPYRNALKAALADDGNQMIQRAMQLQALGKTLSQCLPEPLASHVSLGNVRDGKLVYLVDSVNWARRLLEKSPVLLDAAHAAGVRADEVTVKITMRGVPISAPSPDRPEPVSQAAKAAFRTFAGLTDDEDLKVRLLRLASSVDDSDPL